MKADLLIRGIAQLVTAEGPGPRHGAAMRQLKVVEQAALAIADGTILWVGPEADWDGEAAATVDAQHRAVVPGLVDPHTHAVWAGDRLADFEARISGVPYERILASGGGIWSTIRATAATSPDDLLALAKPRIDSLLRSGATVIEVKSGYGFKPEAEIAMLQVIRDSGQHHVRAYRPYVADSCSSQKRIGARGLCVGRMSDPDPGSGATKAG